MAGLTKALQDRFAGLGEEQYTRITADFTSAGQREYFLRDDRYDYRAHTFIQVADAPQDVVFRQGMRRLRFLRDKLVEDLTEARKIFVFKLIVFDDPAGVIRMLEAMRAYGPTTLLCIVGEDAEHPKGTVEMLQPGLFIGRVAGFASLGANSGERGMDIESWLSACRFVADWTDKEAAKAALGLQAS